MKIKYLLITALILTACSVSKKTKTDSFVSPKSESIETKKNVEIPVTTAVLKDIPAEEMNIGKKLYVTNCTKCHALKDPYKYNVEDWNKILPDMFKRANIDEATKESISKFIYAICRR